MPWTFSYPIPIWRVTGSMGTSGGRTRSSGGGGSSATATVSGGAITGATVQNGGTGYTTPPVVVISGGGGSGATGEAVITNGVVTGVVITNPGTGYTSAPTITISPLIVSDGDYGPQFIITSAFGPAPVQLTTAFNLDTTASTILFTVSGLIQRPIGVAATARIGVSKVISNLSVIGLIDRPTIGTTIVSTGDIISSGDIIESLLFDLEFEDGKDVIELEIFT